MTGKVTDKVKKTKWQQIVLLACVIGLAGCGKPKTAEASQSRMPELATLRQAIPSPTPEVSVVLDRLGEELKYEPGMALKDLAALANHPSLNEAQKQAVTDFWEQARKSLVNRKPAP